ncbi:hypothetical protein GCM10022251_62790 [Phytohabitans flavus]|uniref:Protein involved in plasmid replication-relaxation n=1 Tax=Phytohabitans flavus TaxID=1076124 RepID=A0A6F8Y5C5_9ACTN|nr:replication-relaxation family protein [Phytohabitans flavus]BCB81229.1 hypothetical protein Pflav_076390 [Phytohabitans flavus]
MTTTHPNPFTVPSPKPVPADLFLEEVGRTTGRDRWATLMIAEHRILTTAQLTALGFHPDPAGTERRLRILSRRGWLARFSIGPTRTNTIETVWCLGPLGAVLATPPADPIPSPARTYRQQQRLWAHPHLAELWDVNQFFVNLATHARRNAETDLRAWWSPRTCHGVLTPSRHPAWHGEYIHHQQRHGFWLEPDPGDTPIPTLANRVHRYPPIAERTGLATLLYRAADPDREAALHRQLARLNLHQLTVATTHPDAGHPADTVWQPVGAGQRVALHQLPHTEQLEHPNDEALFLDAANLAEHPIHDPNRPGDESIVDGGYSYTRQP